MKRRQFVFTTAAFAVVAGCGVVPNRGKPASPRVPPVGILAPAATDPVGGAYIAGLKQGLADLGYVDSQTIAFDMRDADYVVDRLPELATELVQLPVDVLVALSSPAVGKGWVASLAHPGGNLTGVMGTPAQIVAGKAIEYTNKHISTEKQGKPV